MILIARASLGGAVALSARWHHGFVLALAAAPLGGNLAVVSAALLLALRVRMIATSHVGWAARPSAEVKDPAGRVAATAQSRIRAPAASPVPAVPR
ncbi:hypothetical protein MMSR116_10865 [Methylobacterium mesophilicum SR1.6/6]|uniref:Uncharacterized protein n=1 Tax=Methylobacterium mesophilicum SR1.6/6 TaxID=908290 RepID=A0A6B9FI80_9HYPH|nr:hypothetical protein [Methylobacterium mesophilicum]QGY02321.1 hypothetical protein MMSR116_10865 [Methylobacterium mesophilicum SR1.6/6]